jgi:putative tryptophan/tyrosine transport system substrate-binding protein
MQFNRMKRREFLALLSGATATWPLTVRAQQPQPMRLIGVLQDQVESDPVEQVHVAAFSEGLKKLGWVEGSNCRIEVRWGEGNADRMKVMAKELVDLRPDAVLARGTPVTAALARETRIIPIVFVGVADPIGSGFATNLAHPNGNITGFSNLFSILASKWVQLLKEIAPRTQHVALLYNPKTLAPIQLFMPSIEAAATALAIQVSTSPVQAKEEIEGVFATQARNSGGSLIVMPDGFNLANRELIVALAANYRVPTIYFNAAYYARLGGLITYGPNFADQYRQAAGYIDRFLKGSKPQDLPIQQPTNFQLVVNLKTAKAFGLDVPLHLQQLADEVIE